MSAGKSTIVNAIVGADLLPSRGTAMTTLPTRIVLDPATTAPVLRLAGETVEVLKQISGEVAASSQREVLTGRNQLLSQFDVIVSGAAEAWRAEYHGSAAIRDALTRINDLIRIAEYLGGNAPGQRIQQLPSLYVPYDSGTDSDVGRVVLVDTPGNDDRVLESRLTGVVAQQLAQAHMVVVVLNFTAMDNTAEGKIRDLVEPAVRDLGSDKLFAVVNKVDARRADRDLDEHGVAAFVGMSLGIPPERRDRIVETKALWALQASRLLAALDRAGDQFDPRNDPTAQEFLSGLYTDEVERDHRLRAITPEELRITAERRWITSGIPQMLKLVLDHSRLRLLRTLLDSSLRRADGGLHDLAESVRVTTAAALRAAQEAETQRADLDQELAATTESAARVGEIERFTNDGPAIIQEALARGNAVIEAIRGNRKFKSKRKVKDFIESKSEYPRQRLQVILDETQQALSERVRQAERDPAADSGLNGDLAQRAAGHLSRAVPEPPAVNGTIGRVELGWVSIRWAWDSDEKENEWGDTEKRYESDLYSVRKTLSRVFGEKVEQLRQQAAANTEAMNRQFAEYAGAMLTLLSDYEAALIAQRDERARTAARQRTEIAETGRQTMDDIQARRGRITAYLDHLSELS
ncbi:dynamin family protein [Acrocarpospora pleiomorpha]|uniref:dynamin family protein n=1 Tax=Acrocarpospora pleiomorpha TaxID=90975 RepID=UPI001478798A|nr:dynamin family protein [Acrocarpospora pleiomorpha]